MKSTISSIQKFIPRIINFAEIGSDAYDEWEHFSEDFLREMDFEVTLPPARGQDGGKDMIALFGDVKYIVSCKHYAHTGKAVGVNDEPSILDRIKAVDANGFIGVYSSVISESLLNRFAALKSNGSIQDYRIFQAHDIERHILQNGCSMIVKRYFPISYRLAKIPARILKEHLPLKCSACGKDLLVGREGLILWAARWNNGSDYIEDMACSCKGICDAQIEGAMRQVYKDTYILSEELGWCVNPAGFFWRISRIMNEIRTGSSVYSEKAWQSEMDINLALAQCSMRDATEEDRKQTALLMSMM